MPNQNTGLLNKVLEESDQTIFIGGATLTLLLIAWIAVQPERSAEILGTINGWIMTNFDWLYLWVVFISFIFILWLFVGPWGRIKLGKPEDEPEFTLVEFFAMFFSAGLAVGLVFYGPVEALSHFTNPPPLFEGADSRELMAGAVAYSILHNGGPPWTIYLLFAIVLGYFAHRCNVPLRPAAILTPFVGRENLDSWYGKALDILVIVISVCGVTVSLGFGVIQFLAGAEYATGFTLGNTGIIGFVLLLTGGFTLSVAVGVDRGIRRISDFNLTLFSLLTLSALVFAPLSFLIPLGTEAVSTLVSNFIEMMLYTGFTGPEGASEWLGSWTVFFWAWWLSFAPMIGVFVARISFGRTIREVILAGMGGALAASVPWFVTMGGSSLWVETTGRADLSGTLAESGPESVGFVLFTFLVPMTDLFSGLFLLLVLTFLITTVDSATLSISILSVGGDQSPSVFNRVTWGLLIGLLTSLLIILGGLEALQTFIVIVGLPIAFMAILVIVGLFFEFESSFPVLTNREPQTSDGEPSKSIIGQFRSYFPDGD